MPRAATSWEDEAASVIERELGRVPDTALTCDEGGWRVAEGPRALARLGGAPVRHALGALGAERGDLVVSFVGRDVPPAMRTTVLAEARRLVVPSEGWVVVVDHNRPRRRLAAVAALWRCPRVPGATPAARWRRQAYPAAVEAERAGLRVAWLRLGAGERIQVIGGRCEAVESPGGAAYHDER